MTTYKRITAVAMILACGAAFASAIDYEFTDLGEGHDWSRPANWDPEGTPGEEDTATIPDELTCEIALADQSVKQLIVEDGAKLEVTARTLTIGPYGGSPSIRLDGDIEFFGQAYLETSQCFLLIRGGGEISCTGSGNLLTIRKPSGPNGVLILGYLPPPPEPGPTIKGNVTILAHIGISKGRLLVDASADVMTIGPLAGGVLDPYVDLTGSADGVFEVTNGRMKFGHCRPYPTEFFMCKWRVFPEGMRSRDFVARRGESLVDRACRQWAV